MAGQFIQTAASTNDTVALPYIDTRYLGIDDFSNPNSDLYSQRHTLSNIIDDYSYQDVLGYLELNGQVESWDQILYSYYESGEMERPVSVGTIVAGATAARAIITLAAEDYTTVGTIMGAGTIARSPLMKNQMVMFANGTHAIVADKTGTGTATQYLIQRRDGTSDDVQAALQDHLTRGLKFAAYSVAYSEMSASPIEGIYVPTIRYLNQMQTFRHIDKISGDADALRRVIKWMGKDRIVDEQRLRQEWRHRMDVQRAMLFSPGGNIILDGTSAGSGLTRLTTGLEHSIRQVGSICNYDDETDLVRADVDPIIGQMKATEGGTRYQMYGGYKAYGGMQRALVEILGAAAGNAIDYSNFGSMGSSRDKYIELGFNGFTYSGITLDLQESRAFSQKNVMGLPGYKYPGMAFFIPGSNQKITVSDNGVKKPIVVPALRTLYTTSSTGQARRFYTFQRGIEQTGIDRRELETFTQQGFQAVNLKKFILLQGD